MAGMLRQPRHRINVASTAALLLAGMIAAPVLAAPERGLLCADDNESSPALTAAELSLTPVNSSEEMLQDHLLQPRAKAAARDAFPDEAPEREGVFKDEEPEVNESAVSDPAIQSASQQKRPIYKRQMYRRDI